VKKFIVYSIRWVSQQLAIPFWMVGHIHLSTNVYSDVRELVVSLGLNLVVAVGFFLDYLKEIQNDRATDTKQKD